MTVVRRSTTDQTLLSMGMALCSDSEWVDGQAVGEPTENALVSDAAAMGMPKDSLKAKYRRVCEAPFDSMRKMMSVIVKDQERFVQYTKGAPDVVLKRCSQYWDGAEVVPMSEEVYQAILQANHQMADDALRVLALGMKYHPGDLKPAMLETELDLCRFGRHGRPCVSKCCRHEKVPHRRDPPIMITATTRIQPQPLPNSLT